MPDRNYDLAFGPIPSRRLGRSLGVNNIPPKVCSYSCVYCQLGRTTEMRAELSSFYALQEVVSAVERRLRRLKEEGKDCDYITLVPDGEPTLDVQLGALVSALGKFSRKVAVITNSSLLWSPEVRRSLNGADLVSVKVDAIDDETWMKINRPHRSLDKNSILEGIRELSDEFDGDLITETMLVRDVNDNDEELFGIAEFISALEVEGSYISTPIRPPAESWVKASTEDRLVRAHSIFRENGLDTELLIEPESDQFISVGDLESDVLGITSVHPMRKEHLEKLVSKKGSTWEAVESLLSRGLLKEVEFEGQLFYIRSTDL